MHLCCQCSQHTTGCGYLLFKGYFLSNVICIDFYNDETKRGIKTESASYSYCKSDFREHSRAISRIPGAPTQNLSKRMGYGLIFSSHEICMFHLRNTIQKKVKRTERCSTRRPKVVHGLWRVSGLDSQVHAAEILIYTCQMTVKQGFEMLRLTYNNFFNFTQPQKLYNAESDPLQQRQSYTPVFIYSKYVNILKFKYMLNFTRLTTNAIQPRTL